MVGNNCVSRACTKACVQSRMMQCISEDGCFPSLLSSCKFSASDPYWVWVNRYFGNLVHTDLNAAAYPHIKTTWKVSHFIAIKI